MSSLQSVPVPAASSTSASQKTILVVDDERAFRDLTAKILEEAGFRVLKAENGQLGLAAFKTAGETNGEEIDLIWTDIRMPEMDGVQMARCIREIRPNIKIVFTSGDLAHCGYPMEALVALSPYLTSKISGMDAIKVIQSFAKRALGIDMTEHAD